MTSNIMDTHMNDDEVFSFCPNKNTVRISMLAIELIIKDLQSPNNKLTSNISIIISKPCYIYDVIFVNIL